MSNTELIPLWIDCDPGQDDIMAILLAAYNPSFDLVGISTTYGNVSLENTTSNALRFLTTINKTNIPVYPGAAVPLEASVDFCPEVHGSTGLNGSKLLPKAKMSAKSSEDFHPTLKKMIEDYDGKLNIAAIGPLTNMALFFGKYPELRSKINYLTIMGAGFKRFNKNGNTEFNIVCDPLAADIVLSDPVLEEHILLSPLDLTSLCVANEDIRSRLLNAKDVESSTNFRALVYELLYHMHLRIKARRGVEHFEGPSAHDIVAIAALLHFYKVEDLEITSSKFRLNVMVGEGVDGVMKKSDEGHGVTILESINIARFWDVVLGAYAKADEVAYTNTIDRATIVAEYDSVSIE
ncbi:hypothetical protein CANARDRAFT_8615 [[Candida] arabinofermentans NRRL YB-2248]|uniref:Inosine/uridine-preferring nucleoside hydrolase domain-containing protein n=1 Tax=[Candida] arabinofermentans NRRL YB-2248 TaxID=983967 RepID=A0A1E4SYP3_9ASCO|nr:hypothetical protein CANARDRAFT_8615 [[Candida] arabinofermentans NRRL YB-2248]